MQKNRLEAFSDGVLAIIITIMVLEIKVPHGSAWTDLTPLFPIFLSDVLSFIYVAIYWNNHHHLMHAVQKVNGKILWANMFLLFWLSLVPFVSGWMGENGFAEIPVAFYGGVLLMCALAYAILEYQLIAQHGQESIIARAISKDWKEKASLIMYLGGIACAFVHTAISLALYAGVALVWLVPDKRFERALKN